jgi:hypothetical protein
MDARLRAEIVATVKQAMTTYNEKWVTAEVLCEHVGTLTPRFMKDHGQMFNRTRVEWDDETGHHAAKDWLYPLYEIKDMITTERTEIGKMTLRHLWRQIQ